MIETKRILSLLLSILLLFGLYLTSLYNYLLFHSMAELFSVIVAIGIFMLAWNSRRFLDNSYLLFLGIAYLFIGVLDTLHLLAYAGMGVFEGYKANLPTQLWIGARYIESISLLIAPLLIGQTFRAGLIFFIYAVVMALFLGSIFHWGIFPTCFVEGVGLTAFKKISEYIISLIFVGAIGLTFKKRKEFDPDVFRLMVTAIIITIFSELAFTFYVHAYGFSNLIGHYLKIVSFILIYRALVVTGLTKPYNLLFKGLKESEGRLRQAQAIAHVGNWELDIREKRITLSEEACRIFGFPVRNIPLDYETFLERIHPKDRRYHKEMRKSLKSNGKAKFEYRILSPENTVRWVWSQGEAHYDKAGIPLRTVGTIQDITEQKRLEETLEQAHNELEQRVVERTAELSKANQLLLGEMEEHESTDEKLKQTERKYRTIADYTYDWEDWAHFDGAFNYVSPSCERISGYTSQEFIDKPSLFREIIVPEDKGIWDEHYSDSREELSASELQFRIQKRGGEIRWIEHACQPAYDEQGNLLGFRASNRDITKRKQMEKMSQSLRDELAHMNRVLSMAALTSTIAHEINQPLAGILSNTQAAIRFLNHEDPDLDEVREALLDIVQDDKRASEVIRRLRGMVKKEEPVHESFDINAVVEASIHLFDSESMVRNISVVKDLKSGISALYGDPIQIQQIIINLLTNAMDAMKDRPKDSRRVLFSTRADMDKGVTVTVTDTGPGLTTDQIETVFDPFYTTKTKGMGLGLSVCRSIIEAHNGQIRVENSPDGGAMFTFWIPFVKEVS